MFDFFFNDKVIYFLTKLGCKFQKKIQTARGVIELEKVKHKGNNCLFHGFVDVRYPDKLILGNNIRIGSGSFFFALGGIKIGDNSQISRNVLIYSGNHNINGRAIPYDDSYILKPVIIGRSVWIGMNVMIVPGVTIGDGAVIGMGAIISKDVPKGAVVVGADQRVVKYRDMKDFEFKDKEGFHFALLWPDK